MTVKHRIPCFDSEVLVRESGDAAAVYQVTIQCTNNPLGSGNTLGTYQAMEEAVGVAERFCSFYSAARETGYYLRSDMFVKPEEPDIPVADVLDGTFKPEQLRMPVQEWNI